MKICNCKKQLIRDEVESIVCYDSCVEAITKIIESDCVCEKKEDVLEDPSTWPTVTIDQETNTVSSKGKVNVVIQTKMFDMKEEPKPACDHVFCFTTADEFEVASETMSRLPYLRSWILENKTPYTEWFSNQIRSFSKGIMIESDSYLMCRFCPTCGEKIDWDEIEKKLNLKKDEES